MSKFVIDNRTILDDYAAIHLVLQVVSQGMISESQGRPQYCFVTSFDTAIGKVMVGATRNPSGSHRFVVYTEEQES